MNLISKPVFVNTSVNSLVLNVPVLPSTCKLPTVAVKGAVVVRPAVSKKSAESQECFQQVSSYVQEIAFLLLPGTSMACLSAAVSVLSNANKLAEKTLYRWTLSSRDGDAVLSDEGFEVSVQQSMSGLDPARLDKLIVCGGQACEDSQILRWLRQAGSFNLSIGAFGAGSYPLARAGLLDDYCCTTHWEYLAAMQEEYPRLLLSSQLYVVDKNRFSCAGGSDVQDLLLYFVGTDHGQTLAMAISDMLICRTRLSSEPQRMGHSRQHSVYMPVCLQDAILLMESNIEEPLSLQEISDLLGISRRQVERLFRKYLDSQPSRYYMELRLNRARDLLQKTSKSITEISIACGFSSTSHFSKNVKDQFGCSPKLLGRQLKLTSADV